MAIVSTPLVFEPCPMATEESPNVFTPYPRATLYIPELSAWYPIAVEPAFCVFAPAPTTVDSPALCATFAP